MESQIRIGEPSQLHQVTELLRQFNVSFQNRMNNIYSYELILFSDSSKGKKDQIVILLKSKNDNKYYVYKKKDNSLDGYELVLFSDFLMFNGYRKKQYWDNNKKSFGDLMHITLQVHLTDRHVQRSFYSLRKWTHYDTVGDSLGGGDEFYRGSRLFRPELCRTELKGTVAGPISFAKNRYFLFLDIPGDNQNSGFYRFTSSGGSSVRSLSNGLHIDCHVAGIRDLVRLIISDNDRLKRILSFIDNRRSKTRISHLLSSGLITDNEARLMRQELASRHYISDRAQEYVRRHRNKFTVRILSYDAAKSLYEQLNDGKSFDEAIKQQNEGP